MDMPRFTPLGPRIRRDARGGVERLTIMPRRNFKLVWLALAALLFAYARDFRLIEDSIEHRDWSSSVVMLILAGTFILWLLAFASEFFGTEIVSVQRGELIVSRGIGRLRRTFRYRVGEIAELTANDPQSDPDAKPHVHHIFFRPRSGAVRFVHGFEDRYFAEALDEAGGETVVRWLLPRLPSSAGELVLGLGYGG